MSVEFGAFTFIVAAIAAALTVLLGWNRPFLALTALVLLIPFRDFTTRWMNVHTGLTVQQVTDIGRWWFAVIAALLALAGGRWIGGLRRMRKWPRLESVDMLVGLVLLLGIIHTLVSPEFNAAVTSFRGYVQPLAVYFLARAIRPDRREVRRLLVLWLVVGLIMGAFALLQATTWTAADYRAEGYLRQDGDLVVPPAVIAGQQYLRPASTVSGPNELGLDMVILLVLTAVWLTTERKRLLPLAGSALVFAGSMGASVSRSGFLSLVAGLATVPILHWNRLRFWLPSAGSRARVRILVGGALGIALVVLVLGYFGIFALVSGTISSLSQQYHLVDSLEAVRFLIRQPWGAGMGLVEPKGALSLIQAGGSYHVEGSIFQIAVEMGVWGLAAWLAFWAVALARVWRNWHALSAVELKVLAGAALAAWLGSLIAFLFLPLMQSISLMVWLWFLLGAGYQSDRFEAAWNAAAQPAAVR